MSSIEQLISDELRAQVEAAVPPPDAWDRFLESIKPTGTRLFDVDSGEADVSEVWEFDVTVDRLQLRSEEGEPPPTWKGWSGVVVAVAATILVVVGVVVVADRNDTNVATDPVPSATTPDVVPSPSTPAPAPPAEVPEAGPAPSVVDSLGYRWSRVPDTVGALGYAGVFEPGFGGNRGTFTEHADRTMASVTVGGPGLVAVGSSGSSGELEKDNYEGARWTASN